MSVKNSEEIDNNIGSTQNNDGYEDVYDDVEPNDDVSDEWVDDDQSDIESEEKQEPVKKKKSKSTFFIVAGVVVLAVIGFLFLSGGGQVPQPPIDSPVINAGTSAVEMQAQPSQPVSVEATVTEAEPILAQSAPPVPEQTGIMNDQNVVEKVENAIGQESIPVPVEQQTIQENLPEAQPIIAQDQVLNQQNDVPATSPASEQIINNPVDFITPNVKSVSDFPTADTIKKPVDTEMVADNPNEETKEIGVPENSVPAISVDENAVKLSDMQNKLLEAEARIADLQKIISEKEVVLEEKQQQQNLVDAREEEIELLKSKISDLEKRLVLFSNKDAEKTIISNVEGPSPQDNKNIENAKPKIVKNVPKKEVPTWILKGAKSDKAVIFDKRSGDLKTVETGDYVDGLGKILSISEQNSLWIVKGSKANLSE